MAGCGCWKSLWLVIVITTAATHSRGVWKHETVTWSMCPEWPSAACAPGPPSAPTAGTAAAGRAWGSRSRRRSLSSRATTVVGWVPYSEQSFSVGWSKSKDLSLTAVEAWEFLLVCFNQVVMVLTIRASYPPGMEVSMAAVINLAKWNYSGRLKHFPIWEYVFQVPSCFVYSECPTMGDTEENILRREYNSPSRFCCSRTTARAPWGVYWLTVVVAIEMWSLQPGKEPPDTTICDKFILF